MKTTIVYKTDIEYKGFRITVADQSHCATIWKNGEVFKMIAGDILADGSHNAIEKAKRFIDAI